MRVLARCLDWICKAFADGAQDEIRLNQLILGGTERPAVPTLLPPLR